MIPAIYNQFTKYLLRRLLILLIITTYVFFDQYGTTLAETIPFLDLTFDGIPVP